VIRIREAGAGSSNFVTQTTIDKIDLVAGDGIEPPTKLINSLMSASRRELPVAMVIF
jgi:hypothetical protein